MKPYYVTVRSVTYAQRGEKLLGHHNIRCTILRTPRWMEAQGCGYALKIWTADVYHAVELLRESKVPIRRVYFQQEGGHLEEINV